MQQAIEQKILSKIYGNGGGWAFSQKICRSGSPFHNRFCAKSPGSAKALFEGSSHGICDYPRHLGATAGKTSPSIASQVARKSARS